MSLSLGILTHKRNDSLRRLLASIARQVDDVPTTALEIVVVDNDAAGGARMVCEEYRHQLSLRYEVQPERSISQSRNLVVRLASREFLAFIDDDQMLGDGWLRSALASASHLGPADLGFMTHRLHVFAVGSQASVLRLARAFRSRSPREGVVPPYGCFTGGCVLRLALLKTQPEPFRLALGLSGGEDLEFFCRMHDAGLFMRGAMDLVTFEVVPVERVRLGYILRRSFNDGQVGHLLRRRFPSPSLPRLSFWQGARRALAVAVGLPLLPLVTLVSRELALHALEILTGYLGGLTGGLRRRDFYS